MNFKEIAKSGDFIAFVCIVLFVVLFIVFVPKIPIKYTEYDAKPIENKIEAPNAFQMDLARF